MFTLLWYLLWSNLSFLIWETVPTSSEVAFSSHDKGKGLEAPDLQMLSYTKGETEENTTNGSTPKWAFCTTTKVGFVLETKQTKQTKKH